MKPPITTCLSGIGHEEREVTNSWKPKWVTIVIFYILRWMYLVIRVYGFCWLVLCWVINVFELWYGYLFSEFILDFLFISFLISWPFTSFNASLSFCSVQPIRSLPWTSPQWTATPLSHAGRTTSPSGIMRVGCLLNEWVSLRTGNDPSMSLLSPSQTQEMSFQVTQMATCSSGNEVSVDHLTIYF